MPPKSKFGNTVVIDPDHGRFDSKREHKQFYELLLRQRIGEIRNLQRQVKFKFGDLETGRHVLTEGNRTLSYLADYTFEELGKDGDWSYVVADSKGCKTKEYLIKKALMRYFYNINIREM
jgi:hypothetical protein